MLIIYSAELSIDPQIQTLISQQSIFLSSIYYKIAPTNYNSFYKERLRVRGLIEILQYLLQIFEDHHQPMLKLTAHMGPNPLRYHKPIRCLLFDYLYSVGENGQIIAWNHQSIEPIYQIVPSVIGDADSLTDMIVTPLRDISREQKSTKIVTVHEDSRIRIFSSKDGVCINLSHHNLIPEKLIGLVENKTQSRFLLCFSQRIVYIIDYWTMRVLDNIQPSMDSFSKLKKGRINQNLQLQLMDRQSKSYRIKIEQLFSQTHLDVGSWISNPAKANRLLGETIQKIKEHETISSYRKIQDPDLSDQLSKIKKKIQSQNCKNIWEQIFDNKCLDFPIVQEFLNLGEDETPTVGNCFFIKNSKLWYFFGTNKGRIIGFPAVLNPHHHVLVQNQPNQFTSPVAYFNFIENLLIVSWENGRLNLYTIDNLDYTIQHTISKAKQQAKQPADEKALYQVDFNQNKVFTQKASSQIKYQLEIYCIRKGKSGTQTLAFQLNNNEIILLDTIHRKLSHFRGMPQNAKIFAVLEIDDYIGVAHSEGIDLFSSECYERTVGYDTWVWSDYQFCEEFKCKNDYHNILSKTPHEDMGEVTALHMFEFSDRYLKSKLDYYAPGLDLLYQTFGLLNSEILSNEMYPSFHFIQRSFTERSIHSTCNESMASVIRLKHSSTRRQKSSQTSFMYQCNLNRQLEFFGAQKSSPTKELQAQFLFYSLFFWDDNQIPYLSDMYCRAPSKFLLKRRYVEQGLGKSFTIYFNNKAKHELSEQLLTFASIASISFLQVCSTKDLELTDEMVKVVQEFTVKRKQHPIQIDIDILSKMALSDSHTVLKAVINILMSTALTQIVPLHPSYDYFILNLKNVEQTKNRVITETETKWFVFLGIGFIYSNQLFDKQQVKILILRLLDTIQLKNFQARPDLTLITLKVFNEGVKKWKSLISSSTAMKIFADLFKIFFCYDGLSIVQSDDRKFNFCFESIGQNQIRKMKHQIIKTIIYLLKEFGNQFLQVLRVESLNQKHHPAYPSSVIEILRQYIKNQRPNTNLVFFIQLLLQCLSPMTPQLRKHVQKNVLATLQLMCSYETISFNHPSQKLSLKTDTNIYIYCLRTSTKWRTISLRDERKTEKMEEMGDKNIKEDQSILQMSPKGTYIALLSDKLKIWRLSSGFWSGVLGAFSQGWNFQVRGIALKWDQSEQHITVINENPSQNKCFKL